MAAQLPQEIFDAIVDELRDDTRSLTLCSASSRLLHYRAVTQLFAAVSVGPSNYEAFVALIASAPYIANFVHTLCLNGGPLKHDQYLVADKDLPSALRKLVNVRELHIRSAFLGTFLATTNPSMNDTLLSFPLSKIHVDEVYFNDSRDLLEVVSAVSSLRSLHVGMIMSMPTPMLGTPGGSISFSLTELCVDMSTSGSIVHALLLVPMDCLETLLVNGCSAYDISTINGVLARSPVQKLVIGKSHLCTSFQRTFWTRHGGAEHRPGLHIHRLRALEITAGDLSTQLQWWVDAFKGIPKREENVLLERMVLNLEMSSKILQPRSWFQPARWRALDETLRKLPLASFVVGVDKSIKEPLSLVLRSECENMVKRGIMDIVLLW